MNAPEPRANVDSTTGEIRERVTETVDSDFERLVRQEYSPREMLHGDGLDNMMRVAEAMALGKISVPAHLRGNVGDCLAIVSQAMQWDMNPYAVASKTHVINGVLGYEAQLVNAVVQQSGAIRGGFNYEFRGDGPSVECRVGAVLRGQAEVTWGEWLSASTVTTKNSPLWKSNPKQQLGYLQVKNWARAYAPGAILGVYDPEELDAADASAPLPPRGPQRKSEAAAAASGAGATTVATEPPPPATPAAAPAPPPAAAGPTFGDHVAPPPPAASGQASAGISGGQVAYLRNKLKAAGTTEASVCDRFAVTSIELLNAEQFDTLKAELLRA